MTSRAARLLIVSCIISTALAADPPPFEKLKSLFSYSRETPLKIRETGTEAAAGGVRVVTLSYEGIHGPVSASLVLPSQSGRHPAIVFMHGLGSKRDEFLAEAILLARGSQSAVSLLIDAPPSRQVGWRRAWDPSMGDHDRDVHIQAVGDIRRGIDMLAARPDVDPQKMAYVGHGYGANWGAILLSIEPRLHAFVLIAGIVSIADLMRGDDPEWADLRYVLGDQKYTSYVDSISLVDPAHYLEHSLSAPVLLQFGRFDPYISPQMARQFANSIHPPPQFRLYDAGNNVNDPQALTDRRVFLSKHLDCTLPHCKSIQ